MLLPKITKTLDLSEYNEAYSDSIEVWVNPPRKYINAILEPQGDIDLLAKAMAEVWDWDLKRVEEFIAVCDEQDPRLFEFAYTRTIELYAEYRTGQRKKYGPPSTS